jgi:hypothetical protein
MFLESVFGMSVQRAPNRDQAIAERTRVGQKIGLNDGA